MLNKNTHSPIDPNKWGKTWRRNELNINSNGGTEVLVEGILTRLNPEYLDHIQLIPSRVRELYDDRIRIYHIHDLPNDTETKHMADLNSRSRFHKIVYCGSWQMNAYHMMYGIPHTHQFATIDTAIVPFPEINKPDPKEQIRLVYTSTPQRGLSILVPVFEELCKKYDNIVLDVFSSFAIYGWGDADKQFEELFNKCKNHPKINYHGYATNKVVREYVAEAHIHAYPSIWMECNSKSLIEAMSAGCICVHPNYAGLTDTSGGITIQYQWDQDPNKHAGTFYNTLEGTINQLLNSDVTGYINLVKAYADSRYNWDRISSQWNGMIGSLIEEYKGKSRSSSAPKFTYRTS